MTFLVFDALTSGLVVVEELICALLWKKVPFKKSKYYNCMFSRHCVRVQILSGGNSLIFTTSLTGRICWTLRSGERITKSMRSFWERKFFVFFFFFSEGRLNVKGNVIFIILN